MIQGVHAETIIFASYQQARSSLLYGGWLLTRTGSEIELGGTPSRRFRMRVRDLREIRKSISCELELHGKYSVAPLMKVELTFVADSTNTRVRLRGATARNLAPASATQDETSRRLANQYGRALLDHIAKAVETTPATSDTPAPRGKAAHPALQRRQ